MTSRLALCAALLGALYSATALLNVFTGWPASPWNELWQFAPSLLLAWCYVGVLAGVYEAAAAPRLTALLGLCLALAYAVLNSAVYGVQLAVVVPALARGEAAAVEALRLVPPNPLVALNGMAYTLMSVSALVASTAFANTGERAVRRAMLAHGALAPVILGAVLWPSLQYAGALWIVTFPVMMLCLARHFQNRA